MKIDLVKELLVEFENSGVHKMKVEMEDIKIELEKAPVATMPVAPMPVVNAAPVMEQAVETAAKEEVASGTAICSPIVGVFYPASSPTAKPYVEVGSKVSKGQTVCIVEAMKVMNEIKAPTDGTITAILVGAEDMVEFDQPIMMIEG